MGRTAPAPGAAAVTTTGGSAFFFLAAMMALRCRSSGSFGQLVTFAGLEPAAGGVRRVVRGAVNVSILGIGGLAERFVVGEVLKGYEAATTFTRSFLERGP